MNGALGIAVNPNTNLIYVASGAGGTFTVINGTTNTVVHSAFLGSSPSRVAVNLNTNTVYVTQSITSGTIHVINGTTPYNVLDNISVDSFPNPIVVYPNTNIVYAASGHPSDSNISVIDGTPSSPTENDVIDLINISGPFARAMAINSDTNRIFVGTDSPGTVFVIDGTTNTAIDNHPIGSFTQGMAVNPNTNLVYSANTGSNTVTVVQDTPPTPTDTTDPVLTIPANVTLEAPADTTPANTGTATATDNADPNPTVTFSDASVPGPSLKTIETITRTWIATDASGNFASDNQIITVQDTTPPVITVLGDLIVEFLEGQLYTDAGATAFDLIDGVVSIVTINPVDENVAANYTVIYNATDTRNNFAEATRTVIVQTTGEAAQDVLTTVEDLNLPPNVELQLTGPLDKTVTFLNDNKPNNDNGSCGQLNKFKNEVTKPKNNIDPIVQAELIAAAEAIQNNLDCSN